MPTATEMMKGIGLTPWSGGAGGSDSVGAAAAAAEEEEMVNRLWILWEIEKLIGLWRKEGLWVVV